MANAREILSRMNSVRDTRKITNAMYLISSNKLRKSKQMLEDTEPYFYTLQAVIQRILRHIPDIQHPYFSDSRLKNEDEKSRALVVITGDKGLAGAYNHNVLKAAQDWMERGANHHLYVVGELGRQYFAAKHMPVEEQFHYTVQNPTMHRARRISSVLMEDYESGKIDEVWILFTQMINSMTEEVQLKQLLPLRRESFQNIEIPVSMIQEEIQMVPTPQAVMDHIVPNYVTGFIYGVFLQ